MKKYIYIISFIFVLLILSSCGKLSKVEKMFTNANAEFVKLTTSVNVTDNEVQVYEYQKTLVLEDEIWTETIVTKELNSSLELSTNTLVNELSTLDRTSLFQLKLDKKNITIKQVDKTSLTLTVKQNHVEKVFGTNFETLCDVSLLITFENDRIKSIEYNYATTSTMQVKVCIEYQY